jgi:hypothetical protein
MKSKMVSLAVISSLTLASSPALAKGCIRGALVGGVAGHYAHHHAVAGAMAGCAAGHIYYKHKENVRNGTADHWFHHRSSAQRTR